MIVLLGARDGNVASATLILSFPVSWVVSHVRLSGEIYKLLVNRSVMTGITQTIVR